MEKSYPSVFTIILNWNQAELTLDCLESLSKSDYPNQTIVLVDNGSTDGSEETIYDRFPSIHLIKNKENLGYSDGNNVGIRYALQQHADYIFLLNNDTVVDPGMLSELVQTAESDPQIGITGPTMYYMDPPEMLWGGENRIEWEQAEARREKIGELISPGALVSEAPVETDYIDSCAILIKKSVLANIGFLSSQYFINFDDLDLNTRARQAGFAVIYVPRARIWHKVSAAMGLASPATTYYMTRNSLLFFSSHAPGPWKIIAPLKILGRTIRTTGAWTIKKEYRTDIYRRKRAAGLLAVRDFFLKRYGKMGLDAAKVCYGK